MNKILVICGPTATGKTKFGLKIAQKFDGEIISADSRQVYTGKNLVHGKDLPPNLKPQVSSLTWRGRDLKFYEVAGVKIWLYDVLEPGQTFNVSFWKECADLVIGDILKRNKLPIVVGGSGLYLKSLTLSLSQISVPSHPILRFKLAEKSVKYLFNYLNKIDSFKAASLNVSDRNNPRRLLRAIEISLNPSTTNSKPTSYEILQIGLTASRSLLYQRIDRRVLERIAQGASKEDSILAANPAHWQFLEHKIARQQLTWFKKQSDIVWFTISDQDWEEKSIKTIQNWYNKDHAA